MPQSKQMSAPRRKDDSQANLAQNTILVVSSSDFGRSLAELLTKLEAEVILCKSRKAAQGVLRQRHLDAILTEKYLGSSDPDGGTELAKFIKAKKRKYLATEYPVVLIVAAWSPSFEERTLHLGAMLAEYDYHDILRRLQTALRLAESATKRLPDYEISYQSPSTTDRLVPGCLIMRIEASWEGGPQDITPPSTEGLLLLVYLLLRLNHPSSIDAIVDIHNNIEFYYGYLGQAERCTYETLKVRYSRLNRFLIKRLGRQKANRILRSESLEDGKSRAYLILGNSVTLTCEVVPMKNRT